MNATSKQAPKFQSRDAKQTVAQALVAIDDNDVVWTEVFAKAICECPAHSVCGMAIVAIAQKANEFCAAIAEQGGIEEDTRYHIIKAVNHQANVIFFG